ncbi:MAG TPA: hypothetical protein VGI33_07840 [Paenibacillus sp.]|jgi:hypothetical protein
MKNIKKIKKKSVFFISLVLIFAILPTTIFAETTLETKDASEVYDVRLFKENQGKFNSYDEVLDSFGLVESHSSNGNVTEAIVVNSVDELAALAATVQQGSQVSERGNLIAPMTLNPFSKVIYDAKTWWVKAFVNVTVDNKRITAINPFSQHLGLTFGSQWNPNPPTPEYHNYGSYSTFNVNFTGTTSLNVILNGVITFFTTSVNDSIGGKFVWD